jgi:A/G-specific adenine glycosylase
MTDISTPLIPWYRQYGRHDLPWQKRKTGYRVWVSEIMLQQTQVKTVIPYYEKFMRRFPTLTALAQAPIDDVLQHWAGLGYYARARNLHKAAQTIVQDYAGRFPQRAETLTTLSGIGESTAAAIVSFAYKQSATILDGNVKRVLTRFYAISGDPNKTQLKNELWEIARHNTPLKNCSEYNQAIMDLGATLCTRSKPNCEHCPLQKKCRAFQLGTPTAFPDKSAPIKRQTQHLYLLVLQYGNKIALSKRPAPGVWGGLWCFPDCGTNKKSQAWLKKHGIKMSEQSSLPRFTHELSHRHLVIDTALIEVRNTGQNKELLWVPIDKLSNYGVPKPIKTILGILSSSPTKEIA